MPGPLVVITGTGTEIGKTHLACALLVRWGRVARVAGIKPVETGVVPGAETDAARLAAAGTFHVKQPPPYTFARPVSPHLAARDVGAAIRVEPIVAYAEAVRRDADGTVLELAGGLFSPLSATHANADVAIAVHATLILLVAPDRLGVLHDVAATTRAAAAHGVTLGAIVLVTPPAPDSSTGSNAAELPLVTDVPVLGVVPRGSVAELANTDVVRRLMDLATGTPTR